MNPIYERIAQELKDTRRTFVWLGEQIGVSKNAITNWKTRVVPAEHHHPIADALGVRWEWLTGRDARKTIDEPAPTQEESVVELSDTGWDALTALISLPEDRQRLYRDLLMGEAAVVDPHLREALAKHGGKTDEPHQRGNTLPLSPRQAKPVIVRKKSSKGQA